MVRYRRKNAALTLDSVVPKITEGHIQNYTKNIGYNGLLCYTKKYIGEMTLLDMKFQFPCCSERSRKKKKQGWIECQGVVVSCEPLGKKKRDGAYEVSVYFSKMSDRNKSLLAKHVSKCRQVKS
jgi:hypothetical protein